jgi:UV excision repair protein RAD23
MLQAVLSQIGQQQPELLLAINSNQAAFLEMMNEPVADAPAAPAAPAQPAVRAAANPFAGVPGMEALGNPVQLAQMLQAMPPQEQQAMAQMMGMDVNQLQQLAQMISAMPPEQVQQHMNMAMQAQGLGGLMGGAAGAGRGGMGGAQVLRLSEEEMAAVDRLTEMGFDRTEAAQAYLACDKNEALAANLLMDGGFGGFGGFGGMDGDDDMGGDDEGGDDDMYD